jgi:hypothetical protein
MIFNSAFSSINHPLANKILTSPTTAGKRIPVQMSKKGVHK